jgi:hypothetical protein
MKSYISELDEPIRPTGENLKSALDNARFISQTLEWCKLRSEYEVKYFIKNNLIQTDNQTDKLYERDIYKVFCSRADSLGVHYTRQEFSKLLRSVCGLPTDKLHTPYYRFIRWVEVEL